MDVVGASADDAYLDLRWPQKRDGEAYHLLDADLIAELVLALKGLNGLNHTPTIEGRSVHIPPKTRDADVEASPAARVERECPWCAELILAKARVCRHCAREVRPLIEDA